MSTRSYSAETIINRIFHGEAVRTGAEISRFCTLAGIDDEIRADVEKMLVPLKEPDLFTASHIVNFEKDIERYCSVMAGEIRYSAADINMPTAVDTDIIESVCMDFISRSKQDDDAAARASVHAGLMKSSSRLLVLEGAPGTAKSTTAIELMKAYAVHRKRYLGDAACDYKGLWILAMNPFAMEKWRERAGVQGATIDQILATDEMGVATIPEGAFVTVDEAGLIGTEKTALLLKKAVECKWQKLVLMGDIKQDSPEEYGQPLDYILRRHSNISFVLKTPFRQKNDDERNFVRNLYEGKGSEAFEYLDARKRMIFGERKEIISSVARSVGLWRRKEKNIMKQCFILVRNVKDADAITDAVMEFQRTENIVTECYPYAGASREYMIGKGDRVVLQQTLSVSDTGGKVTEYGRGSLGTVTYSDKEKIMVRPDRKDNSAADVTIGRDNPYVIAPAYCLLFSQAQGIAADNTAVVITEPINGPAMISACSRHRYRCDLYIDKEIYPSADKLAADAEFFPVKRMPYLDGDISITGRRQVTADAPKP